MTVVPLTLVTLINLFNPEQSGYRAVSAAPFAYALSLTLANQLEYPYQGPLSVSMDPLLVLMEKYEVPKK